MEVSGIVFRSVPCYSGAGFRQSQSKEPTKLSVFRRSCEFSDEGHLRYYGVVCKKKEKVKSKDCDESMTLKKKRMKMIKGLSKDLSALTHMRFGGEEDLMEEEFKGKMISEAAEALLAQLQVLKAEEKEMKRRRKEEKAAMKAAQMKAMGDCNNASSSSSESSNSECGEVVDMSCLRSGALAQDKKKIDQPQPIQVEASIDTSTQSNNTAAVPCSSSIKERNTTRVIESPSSSTCCNDSSGSTISGSNSSSRNSLVVGASSSSERIQVCMGGKCKKSGAVELLGEFERMIGVEGAVVGCKCMGKCRDGPNVRVLNQCNGNAFEKEVGGSITNPLCIGVGLEDVGAIVANFFGEKKDMGMMAAA